MFAHDNKYAIQVDEETVWYAVLQTQYDRPLEGNYDIIRLFVEQEVIYRVKSQNDLGQALNRYLTNDGLNHDGKINTSIEKTVISPAFANIKKEKLNDSASQITDNNSQKSINNQPVDSKTG